MRRHRHKFSHHKKKTTMHTNIARYSYLLILIIQIATTATSVGQPAAPPIPVYKLTVSTGSTTVLVFPAPITAVDRGTSTLLAKSVTGVQNVLKVKAGIDSLVTTSLHVFTADGHVFPFEVQYQPAAGGQTLDFSAPGVLASAASLQFSGGPLTETTIAAICRQLTTSQGYMGHPRSKKIGDVHLIFRGCYLYQGIMFMQLKLHNHSAIPYGLDFNQAVVRDRAKSKRTSEMVVEKTILHQSNMQGQLIPASTDTTIVLAFPQFTIADSKLFILTMFERAGDRHLELRLKGNHLLRSQPLPPAILNAVNTGH